ncbi:response regulator [Piscinibacter sp.]|uniref:response regulator n=1 Tax=Piscinibacter sp. TaxID=1903157 RepID=UPI002B8A389E|nr:response regulator [Albitalea sp.]HUG21410.1 response regulator [Albitalea sp.]
MRLKLRLSIMLAVVVGLLIPAALGSLLTLDYEQRALTNRLSSDHARLTEILAFGVENALWNVSPDSARPLVHSVLGDERVVRVVVHDEYFGVLLAGEHAERRTSRQFERTRDVVHDGNRIGRVTVEIDSGLYDAELSKARTALILIVLGQLLLALLLIVGLLNARLIAPIRRLMNESERLARRELDVPFVWHRGDELGSLGAGLERTRQSLQALFDELEAKNRQLSDDIRRRIDDEQELKRHREHLEDRIRERTAELEVARDKAEVANLAKSSFLAGMSHELRTPLNAILGYAQILQHDKGLAERSATGLATIQQSGEHLLALINDILDLSRIEAGRLDLFVNAIDLPAFLQGIADTMRIKVEQKGLLFTLDSDGALPSAVQVDDKRLRQVLLNLLDNAVKFTDRGGVSLRVRRLPGDDARPRLRFEVEDTGVGIEAAHFASIFLPFEQAGDPQRRLGGAGLGLAVSRQLARRMGSDIELHSEVGRGSRFWFDIETMVAEAVPAPAAPKARIVGYEGPRKKVLVVDDVEGNRAVVCDLLRSLGFDVLEADNGAAGLRAAQEQRPDLVLMDIVMPVMDGLTATQRLRQSPDGTDMPVIIVSAGATEAERGRSLQVGGNAFLVKPIAFEALFRHIGELLRLRWIHASTPAADTAPPDAEQPLVAPSAEQLEQLYQLARIGNMRSIRQRADELSGQDARYAPFAERLRTMAGRFQSRAILEFIAHYREQAATR